MPAPSQSDRKFAMVLWRAIWAVMRAEARVVAARVQLAYARAVRTVHEFLAWN